MRRLMTFAISILAIGALAVPASAQFPGLGGVKDRWDSANSKFGPYLKKAQQLDDINKPWTQEDEEAIGAASAAKLISVFGLYENKPMQKYVNLVGGTVAAQGARGGIEYHFAILDTDSLNAMGLPGGFIFVTRGALANMKNEAELAGVLAHEVAHVDGRHLENEVKKQKLSSFAAKTAQEQASQNLSKDQLTQLAINKVGQAAAQAALTTPFSSGDESNADKNGLGFAAKAGYASSGLSDFLKTLAAAQDDPQFQQATGQWATTHPPFNTRIENLAKLMGNYPANGQTLEERFKQNVSEEKFAAAK